MAQDTYWGSFEEISRYNVQLNYLEKMWLAWYSWMGNDVLATGIMSFVIHEALYFGRSLPWIIIDCIPYFRRYKIQQVGLLQPTWYHPEILMACSTRSPRPGNRHNAPPSSSSPTLLSNFLKSGSSIPCASTLVSPLPFPSLAPSPWPTRLPFFSSSRIHGITGRIA